MKHAVIPIIEDSFGIGQVAVARIRMATATDWMGGAAYRAFGTHYVPDEIRKAARATFYAARREYDHAKEVLEAHYE